ncbi:MAG: IS1380 family transposase [Planctomycetales bacterium]
MAARKQRNECRLDKHDLRGLERPMLTASNVHYELAERASGTGSGGVGSIHLLAQRLGLPEAINRHVRLFKIHLPYHESDHVLNLAYNALCGGRCLEDLELRRQDEAYMNGLGARRIPDPTTAGDFCRRFTPADIYSLFDAQDEVRLKVWKQQPKEFFRQAIIDMDGVMVETSGECKSGMDINYKGQWGYHPLIVSLANTGELLSLVNRSGNRPSHEGAAAELDRAISLCLEAGFASVLARGDTDFSQTKYLDGWDDDPRVRFIFGMDASPTLNGLADDLPANAWRPLSRRPRRQVKTSPRSRPARVKEQIVRDREFKNIRLVDEEIAEMDCRPQACKKSYRIVIARKNLSVEKGQQVLFNDYRYFFYIANDRDRSAEEVVFSANDRCDQENLKAQLKSGVRSLYAPVDNLISNWAYMAMTALAWNLKAWWALSLPESGRWRERHREDKRRVLRMEFRTFVENFMRIPCQVARTRRRIVWRLLAWNRWQPVFFRLMDALRLPSRC